MFAFVLTSLAVFGLCHTAVAQQPQYQYYTGYQLNKWYYYPYQYFPHNYWPAQGPRWPEAPGMPYMKPPYGRLTAIDMTRGEFLWQVAHGETPDFIRNHAALKGLTIPRTGQAGAVGVLVTRTLAIAGEPLATTAPGRPRGAMLRAYDKASGQEVGAVYMPAQQSGSPMTYLHRGRQFIVVAVSGGNYSGEYIALALPEKR